MLLKLSTGLNGLLNIIFVKGIKSRKIFKKNRGHQKSRFFATCKNSENSEKKCWNLVKLPPFQI